MILQIPLNKIVVWLPLDTPILKAQKVRAMIELGYKPIELEIIGGKKVAVEGSSNEGTPLPLTVKAALAAKVERIITHS